MGHVTFRGESEQTSKTEEKTPSSDPRVKVLVRKGGAPKKTEELPRVFERRLYDDRRNAKHPDVTMYRSPDFRAPVPQKSGKRKKPSAFAKNPVQSEVLPSSRRSPSGDSESNP